MWHACHPELGQRGHEQGLSWLNSRADSDGSLGRELRRGLALGRHRAGLSTGLRLLLGLPFSAGPVVSTPCFLNPPRAPCCGNSEACPRVHCRNKPLPVMSRRPAGQAAGSCGEAESRKTGQDCVSGERPLGLWCAAGLTARSRGQGNAERWAA